MQSRNPRRSVGAAVALFFVAPLVAEFLLGNLPIQMLPALVVLAPMYGGGALLIREVARRNGRAWPTIVLLALAYGIVEEAFTTQTLFNPNYLHLHLNLLTPAYIAALGIGGWWTAFVLTLHTAWSISTPIAIVEACVPQQAETPWLGRIGMSVVVVLFGFGLVSNTLIGFHNDHFVARPSQFAVFGLAAVLLSALAFLLPFSRRSTRPGAAPNCWLVALLGLAAGSAILTIPPRWGWGAAAAVLAVDLGTAAAVLFWSHFTGWTLRHKLFLASGAALAYGWHAFIEKPVIGNNIVLARTGNVIFASGAVALILFAALRVSRVASSQQQSEAQAVRL